jgi:hypothetical protein
MRSRFDLYRGPLLTTAGPLTFQVLNMADNIGAFPSLQTVARALGGEINGGEVCAPGPGCSPKDRSLSVMTPARRTHLWCTVFPATTLSLVAVMSAI